MILMIEHDPVLLCAEPHIFCHAVWFVGEGEGNRMGEGAGAVSENPWELETNYKYSYLIIKGFLMRPLFHDMIVRLCLYTTNAQGAFHCKNFHLLVNQFQPIYNSHQNYIVTLKLTLKLDVTLCSSRKYLYLQVRDFFLRPPHPSGGSSWASSISLNFWSFRTTPTPRKLQSLPWGEYGYLLEQQFFSFFFLFSRRCEWVAFLYVFGYLFFFRTCTYFGFEKPPEHSNAIQLLVTLRVSFKN